MENRNPGNPMPQIMSAGSMILNVFLVAVIIGVAIIAVVFIKGGIEAIQTAFSDLSHNIANFKPFA